MDRELLLEIGTEEIPASWLPRVTAELGDRLAESLAEHRLEKDGAVETYSTPRRLAARVARVAERQTDLEDLVLGPPVSAGCGPDGQPTAAAVGFARKQGVEVGALETVETPRGLYLAYRRRQPGKAAVDVLPAVLAQVLRSLNFPRLMHWDAWLDDGRGELLFGRPIRWLVYVYGGRVVPFVIKRSPLAESPDVQDVHAGAYTFGHRWLSAIGRPGRALKVKSFDEYRARLLESFVLLDRQERHDRIARELDAHARRLGGRLSSVASSTSSLLAEVPDLVEYPDVVAGVFPSEFLSLPPEVLTTTMIHHQHFFPVVNDAGALMPAFLVVVNTQADDARTIARNAERVLTARLRDARFFLDADRRVGLHDRVAALSTLLVHKRLGSYQAKAHRISELAVWIVREAFGKPELEETAREAGLLAKVDLTTHMVRELTELQGTMGGIYAREAGLDEAVWRAISLQYLPLAVEADAPPSRADLGAAAGTWAAVSLADKLDTVVGLFAAGERPTGTRDPFGLRRQAHGICRILVDLPDLTGIDQVIDLSALVEEARAGFDRHREAGVELLPPTAAGRTDLAAFLDDRVRYLFQQRGFGYDEINAVAGARSKPMVRPLEARRRLEALRAVRGSKDFEALAVAFKRVKNLARELAGGPVEVLDRLVEPAEVGLVAEYRSRRDAIRRAVDAGDYLTAFRAASGFRPAVDRLFNEVFVMVDDVALREQRLTLIWRLHELLLELADISEVVPSGEATA